MEKNEKGVEGYLEFLKSQEQDTVMSEGAKQFINRPSIRSLGA